MPIYEPGKCTTGCDNYINSQISPGRGCPEGNCNVFGNCKLEGLTSLFPVAGTVPIKTALSGTSLSPWVKLRFESQYAPWSVMAPPLRKGLEVEPSFWDFTEITTGNISQPGCNGKMRPRLGLSIADYAAYGGGDPNSPLTLDTNNSNLYELCEEKCRAAIKSFQYSWGTIHSGNKCRITIVDELGSSLNQWIGRLIRNPTNTPMAAIANAGTANKNYNTIPQGTYKMKITFGWLVLGGEDGNSCPIDGSSYGPAYCTSFPTGTNPVSTYTNPASANSRLICSPPLWFIPSFLTINDTNGRFIYEIEGADVTAISQHQPSSRTYGTSKNQMHFALAVKKLGAESLPPFDVDFLQTTADGTIEPLMFTVNTNSANIPDVALVYPIQSGSSDQNDNICVPASIAISDIPEGGPVLSVFPTVLNPNPAEIGGVINQAYLQSPLTPGPAGPCRIGYMRACERLGPLGVWACDELGPLQTITQWLTKVSAQGLPDTVIPNMPPQRQPPRRGIVMNYDPAYTRKEGGIETHGRLILWATPYPHCAQTITGAGNIKGVYVIGGGPCSPVLSFTPTMRWPFQMAAAAGGAVSPFDGRMGGTTDGRQVLGCHTAGRGPRQMAAPEEGQTTSDAIANVAAHSIANTFLSGVEAELKVQGDPSDYLCCQTIGGLNKTVALVVLNPYYLNDNNGNPEWSTLTKSSCNSLLTNRNWFITGVDHQIKEGSYITTYKLRLFVPNAEVNPDRPGNTPVALGGQAFGGGLSQGLYVCSQGTIPYMDDLVDFSDEPSGSMAYIAGPVGNAPGADLFDDSECSQTIGVM